MKPVWHGAWKIPAAFMLATCLTWLAPTASAVPVAVHLGTAASFAVLAGSGITVAGAAGATTINGDIGTTPTPAITGLGNVVLNGVNQAASAVTTQAKSDLLTAYNDVAGRAYDMTFALGYDLVGQTLTAGVYNDASSFFLSGNLTLDAQGNSEAVWIFQAGSTLITASDSRVTLVGGAQACHVFWQVGSSATLGTDTSFSGNLLAATSITLNTGTTLNGRALALDGAVTLDNNFISQPICNHIASVPDGGSTLGLVGIGWIALLLFQKRNPSFA